MLNKSLLASVFAMSVVGGSAYSQDDIFDLSLEEIADVKITSVSKRIESAFESSAAVYIISQEDIKNSTANYLPELLRAVPGLQVSRIDSGRWAVSARGFARDFASRMLVLVDGRSIYNPLVSGISWDRHNVPLSNIERVEVIKGPGATIWGANAVNGVINIITKSARESQGMKFVAGVGDKEKYFAEGIYSSRIGKDSFVKLYAKSFERKEESKLDKSPATGEWGFGHAGFRFETALSEDSELTVLGEIFEGEREEDFDHLPSITSLTSVHEDNTLVQKQGGSLTAKYKNHLSKDSVIDLQVYFDNNQMKALPALLNFRINTFDVDFQHSISLPKNELVWGLGYRLVSDKNTPSNYVRYDANDLEQNNQTFSAFVLDRLELSKDKLYLTLGSKFEHNDFTGFEWQPSARIAYLPNKNNTLWASFSKAARIPTRNEQSVVQTISGTQFGYVGLFSSEDYESEDLYAYEVGYRNKPSKKSTIDFAAFYNNYENLRSFESGPVPSSYADIPFGLTVDNKAKADNFGFELSAKWDVSDKWSLDASYSFIKIDIDLESSSTDFIQEDDEGNTAKNMLNLHSHWDITDKFDMDNYLYYVDNLTTPDVKSFVKFDTRIGYKPNDKVRLDLVGENLFDSKHQEFNGGTYNSPSEISRSVYGKLTLSF